MENETKVADATTGNADATADKTTKYTIEEVIAERDKAFKERDKAKETIRKREEADAKAAEEKMKADGQLKELLEKTQAERDALKSKADAFEIQQTRIRESLLAKLSDADKKIAEKLNDIDDLSAFVSRLTESKAEPYNLQQKSTPNEPEYYTKAQIDAMTPEQVRANLEKVNKSLAHFK